MNHFKSHITLFYSLVVGVIFLFLNDRIWKYEYANWLTGKLSDFVGLLIFPIFIAVIFPKLKSKIAIIVGVLFVFWKTPFTNEVIQYWNEWMPVTLVRTIDYTDFMALISLPIAHALITQINLETFRNSIRSTFHPVFVYTTLIFSFIAFCSTSVQEPSYPKGDILIDKSYKINKTEDQILSLLKKEGFQVSTNSIEFFRSGKSINRTHFQIDTLFINKESCADTLYQVNFKIRELSGKSSLRIINLSVEKDWSLQNWKTLKSQTKRYRKLLETELIDKLH